MTDDATHAREMRELAKSAGCPDVIIADIFSPPQPTAGTGGLLALIGIALRWRASARSHDLPEKVLVVVEASCIRFIDVRRTLRGWRTKRTVRVLPRTPPPIEASSTSAAHFVFLEAGDSIELSAAAGSGGVAAELVRLVSRS